MTENMKKYLELISKDEEAKKKLADYEAKVKEQSQKDIIAYAAEKGIELTEADFAAHKEVLPDDEMESVAGAGACACIMGGGGTGDGYAKTCACILSGTGEAGGLQRCACFVGGGGDAD